MAGLKEAIIVTSAIIGGGLLGASCGDGSNEVTPTPGPVGNTPVSETPAPETATATPLATPEVVSQPPFTQIPNVADNFRGFTETIYDYLITRRLAGNRLRLVDNDDYDLDVFKTGTGETKITYGLTAKIKNPESVQRAVEVRNRVCTDLLEAAGSVAAGLSIQFGVAVPNAGADPMGGIGFTLEKAQDFTRVTTCGDVAA